MNDPHVVALFYNIEHSASVVYREAEPREYEAAKLGQSRAALINLAIYQSLETGLRIEGSEAG